MPKKFALILLVVLAMAACSSSPEPAPTTEPKPAAVKPDKKPAESCPPGTGPIAISATEATFDKKCLASKAGEKFTVVLNNTDAFGHNFAILEKSGGNHLFTGTASNGPTTTTYEIPSLSKGTYLFQCDFHPFVMQGPFIVS
ncbi:MAG: cupredoxin domain-containing protein [Actinomycetota bacterium]